MAEPARRDPEYRGGLPRRALMVRLELPGLDEGTVRHYRQALFAH